MKKTLIALMALTGGAMAMDTVFTTTNSKDSATGGYEADGFAFNLSGTAFTTTSNPVGEEIGDEVQLVSMSLQTRNSNSTGKYGKYYLVLTDTNFNVLACSNEQSTPCADESTFFTWTFGSDSKPITISTSGDYFVIAQKDAVSVNTTLVVDGEGMNLNSKGVINYGGGSLDFGGLNSKLSGLQFIQISDSDNDSYYDTYDFNKSNQYAPNVTIVTKAIPEPATATLSLLALAGLAARRRRK